MAGAESDREGKKNDLGKQAAPLLCMLLCGMRIDRTELPPSARADATFSLEDISDTDAWTNYRCRKADIRGLQYSILYGSLDSLISVIGEFDSLLWK